MIEFIGLHMGEISTALSIILSIGGIIFWSHSKLHADIQEVKEEARNAHHRIDAMGQRIDAMGHRIDGVYTVIMTMLQQRNRE